MVAASLHAPGSTMTNSHTPARCVPLACLALVALNLTLATGFAPAQTTTLPSDGVAARLSRHLLLTHARIVTEPG